MTEDRAISLNAVLELIETCNSSGLTGIFCSYDDGKRFTDMIKKLPPVTPNDEEMAMQYQRGYIDGFKEGKATFESKTGHWIIYQDCEGKTRQCTCDQCGYKTGKYTWYNPNFCAECGCRMVEPQEGSE